MHDRGARYSNLSIDLREVNMVTRRATKSHAEVTELARAVDERIAECFRLLAEADALLRRGGRSFFTGTDMKL